MNLYFKAEAGGIDFEYSDGNKQNFLETQGRVLPISGAAVWGINILYAFPIVIKKDVTIEDLRIAFNTSVAGKSVFGLYDMLSGLPNNLLFQTTPFDNSVTGTQIYSLSTPLEFKKGIYFVAYNTSSSPTIFARDSYSVANIFGADFVVASANIRLSAAYNYTGTLPANFGSPVSGTNGLYVPNVLFTI